MRENLADGSVPVIGQHLDNDGDATGAVALKGDFLVVDAFQFACAALYGALDVLGGHVFSLGGQDSGTEPGISVGVSTTPFCGNGDFLDKTSEYLAALGIERALFVLDCGPFRMAGHVNLSDRKDTGADPHLTL